MSELQKRTLTEWLDDLCVRFIINLPQEELESVERICFQVEEAQWFYEDFVRPLDPTLPSMNLKKFCMVIFQHCPLLSEFSQYHHFAAFSEFLAYKQRVPVRGAIMLNDTMDQVVLVKGWKKGARWSFPRGKINKDESDLDCAIREVYEETGYDLNGAGLAGDREHVHAIEVSMREQHMKLFVFRCVPMDTYFEPRTRKEISKISWYKLSELPTVKQIRLHQNDEAGDAQQQSGKFYMVAPFLSPLKHWIRQQRKRDRLGISATTVAAMPTDDERIAEQAVSDVEATIRREQEAENGSGHFNNLLAGLRASSVPGEAAPGTLRNNQTPGLDPAAALKRMLSVGQTSTTAQAAAAGTMAVPFTVTQHSHQGSGNILLDMLRSPPGSAASQMQTQTQQPPATPLEQVVLAASRPRTPPHHHHNTKPPLVPSSSQAAQPPSFPFSSGPQPLQHKAQRSFVPPVGNDSPPHVPLPLPRTRPEHTSQLLSLFRSNAREDGFGPPVPQMQPERGSPTPVHVVNPAQQNSHMVPQASRLPPPKLTTHTMTLLNAFKSPAPSRTVTVPTSRAQLSELLASDASPPGPLPSSKPPRTKTAGESSHHPPINQQATLLDLFRPGSTQSQRPVLPQDPAELAAQPSPHPSARFIPLQPEKPDVELQTTAIRHNPAKDITSATVTGTLHSPHLGFIQRQHEPVVKQGNDPGNGPIVRHPASNQTWGAVAPNWLPDQSQFVPAEALSPASAAPEVARSVDARQTISFPLHRALHDVPGNVAPMSADRLDSLPVDQKDTLLSLLTGHPTVPGVGAKRPTASGILSPVSQLPGSGRSKPSSALGSPAGAEGKSRFSSIASLAGNVMPDAIPSHTAIQHSLPATDGAFTRPGSGAQGHPSFTKQSRIGSPTDPIDKSVLLGFLQNVAKGP